jgi:hypothetical protein
VVGYALFLVALWVGHVDHDLPTPFPPSLYGSLPGSGYRPTELAWGRLVDVAVVAVVSYAVLTAFWRPIARTVGWLLVPLGQASLRVAAGLVLVVVVVASIPGLDRSDALVGTVVHTAALLLLWLAVRPRRRRAAVAEGDGADEGVGAEPDVVSATPASATVRA